MANSDDKTEDRERGLRLREQEVAAREREVAARKRELEVLSNQMHHPSLPVVEPEPSTGGERATESLGIFFLKLLKNGCYASGTLMLATTLGAIYTASPSPTLVGAGFSIALAMFIMGVIFHLALWREGAD